MSSKKNSGITLVALVITIIVLLILAGVSISLVVGENGIIGRTINSREKTKHADAYERVYTEVDGSYDESGTINLDDLNKNLRENLEGVKLKTGEDTYADLTEETIIESLPATVRYNGYDFDIEGQSTTSSGKLKVPAEDKELDLGGNKDGKVFLEGWKHFYSEGDTEYFIYDKYLSEDSIPVPSGIEKYGITVSTTSGGMREILIEYLRNSDNWDFIAKEVRDTLKEQGVDESLLNKVKATGAPTAEQFVKAYNLKYGPDGNKLSGGELSLVSDSSNGYKYSLNGTTEKEIKVPKEAVGDPELFPKLEGCSGYWLASPSSYYDSVCNIYYYKDLCFSAGDTSVDGNFGIRPIISLPSEIFE